MPKITVPPQDRTAPEKLELHLHPALIRRLNQYAKSIPGTDGKPSDRDYVAAFIFDQALPPLKATKPTQAAEGKAA